MALFKCIFRASALALASFFYLFFEFHIKAGKADFITPAVVLIHMSERPLSEFWVLHGSMQIMEPKRGKVPRQNKNPFKNN